MKRIFVTLGLMLSLAPAARGQAPAGAAAFEASDVRVHARSTQANPQMTGGVIRAGRFDLRNATMLDLIAMAYTLDPDSVIGGPSWLEMARFDIAAKAPAGATQEASKVMLQALLADRFRLAVHKDTRPMPGFALTPGRGRHKLTEAKGDAPSGCRGVPSTVQPGQVPQNVVQCTGMTMADFVVTLRGMAGNYTTGPILDQTGLTGAWDFDLKWTSRGQLGPAGPDGISIFDAVDKQLGLALTPQTSDQPVLVVDSVNAEPTPNAPDIATTLPPVVGGEFDAATVKLSPPDTPTTIRVLPGGRIDLQGVPLRLLISLAWEINDNQLVANAPAWIDSTRYSIVASAGSSVAGSGNNMQVDIGDLEVALRKLLADEFRLATHFEDRPVNAYTLTLDKPKLQRANPADRTRWHEGPAVNAADTRDKNPILSRLVTCQNMTMAQFAGLLPNIAPGYLRLPVDDATGLEGSWTFTFTFSPVNLTGPARGSGAGPGGAAPSGGAAIASDPNGALTLYEALDKQLGVKLEQRRRPLPVLVIDHVEEKPTE